MTLEELVHKLFSENTELAGLLAKYAGKPAIFFQLAPTDSLPGWKRKDQFPRIVYNIEMLADQERKSVGTMTVSIYCDLAKSEPELIAASVKKCLEGMVLIPEGGFPFCFAWARSDPFEVNIADAGARIIGTQMRFDVLEFPPQETTDPDPALAMGAYVKSMYKNAVVLGIDRVSECVNTAERPVVYCRIEDIQATTGHCMNTISWFNAKIGVHVLSPDYALRTKMISAINQQLGIDGEVIMLDQSPMIMREQRVNGRADYLREGQLMVTGKYGCLRHGEMNHRIMDIGVQYNERS